MVITMRLLKYINTTTTTGFMVKNIFLPFFNRLKKMWFLNVGVKITDHNEVIGKTIKFSLEMLKS